jgi:hypothetical protein
MSAFEDGIMEEDMEDDEDEDESDLSVAGYGENRARGYCSQSSASHDGLLTVTMRLTAPLPCLVETMSRLPLCLGGVEEGGMEEGGGGWMEEGVVEEGRRGGGSREEDHN